MGMIRYSTTSIRTALTSINTGAVQLHLGPGVDDKTDPSWADDSSLALRSTFEKTASEAEESVHTILRMMNRNGGKEKPRTPSHPPSGRGPTYLDGEVPKVGLYSCNWLRL